MDAYKANSKSRLVIFLPFFVSNSGSKDATEAEGLLDAFIAKLRAHPALARSWIFFCCERNTGQTSSFLAKRLIPFQRHGIICQNDDGDCGWWSLETTKVEQLYAGYFAIRSRGVRFLDGWVCPGPFTKQTAAKHREGILQSAGEQLVRYGPAAIREKVKVTGRLDRDGQISHTFTDDLAFTTCFLIWLLQKIVTREAPGIPYGSVWPLGRGTKRRL